MSPTASVITLLAVRRFRAHRYRRGRTHRSTNAVVNMVAAEFDLIRMATDLSSLIRAFGCDSTSTSPSSWCFNGHLVMPTPSEAGQLRQRLRQALVGAMKGRDSMAIAALRTTLGAIDNAEAVDVPEATHPDGWAHCRCRGRPWGR